MTALKTSKNGLDVICRYESLHDGDLNKIGLQPKRDPVGIFSICYGHALFKLDGTPVRDFNDIAKLFPQFLNMDDQQAMNLLLSDLVSRENALNSTGLDLKQNQFDSLISFIYNEGVTRFKTSTLLKYIINKANVTLMTQAFLMWNKGDINGDGKLEVLPGLTYRRQTEALLYNTGELKFFN